MKYFIFLLALLLFSCQSDPGKALFKEKSSATEVGIRSISTRLDIDTTQLKKIISKGDDHMTVDVPYLGDVLSLDLEKINLFTGDFRVTTDQGENIQYSPGLFYTGKVHGDSKSLVSISVFNDAVNGIISSPTLGELNLGRTDEVGLEHMVYNSDDAIAGMQFTCGDGITTPELDSLRESIIREVSTQATGCVGIDFELTNEIYENFNRNPVLVTNWLTTLFAGVKTIYANEGISILIKYVYIWTTDDGYSDNASTALSQLITKRRNDPNFTGNFTHLVRGQSSNLSGIAYVGVMCVPSYRFGFSAVTYSYASYPSFSWSTEVIAHELGHNMGSPHTHSCSWPGGPIDNCYTQEGTCTPGPTPPLGGGTIMSYCHMKQTVGIRFSNGFGPLPSAKIMSYYSGSGCLTVCGPGCSDGIKNGTETGVDCGGSCAPCPVVPTCTDGVKNGTETGIDCGGSCKPCSTCNDGIKNQNETGIDCGGVCPPCPVTPTCSDGIQNGTETGVDCGGSCPPCPVPPTGNPLISQGKTASQSSNYNTSNTFPASRAFDGIMTGYNFNHTRTEVAPWIQVDLGDKYQVSLIRIINRTDCCGYRLSKFRVFVANTPTMLYTDPFVRENTISLQNGQKVEISTNSAGRYVRLWADNKGSAMPLHVAEIQVYGVPVTTDPCVPRDTIYRVLRDSAGKTKCPPF